MKIPIVHNIHKKILEAVSVSGALNMGEWHVCDTTHCWAGWAVYLAGAAGKRLEEQTSTLFAAMQIFKKSAPNIEVHIPYFFETNEQALLKIKACAEAEKAATVNN